MMTSQRKALVPAVLTLLGACVLLTEASAQTVPNRCGSEVQVRTGETLSSIAARCDVTETRILDLNPSVQGSKDLKVGMSLKLASPPGQDMVTTAKDAAAKFLDRLGSYGREASQKLEQGAEHIVGSVSEFVERNPDLHQRVRKLGQRLSIPGMEKVEAQVSLSVRRGIPGTSVTLSVIGLPPDQRVEIGGGVPEGDYAVLESARTTAQGTLQATVQLPRDVDPARDFIFVVASADHNIAVRSARFDVVEAGQGAAPSR
jgi:LysM repeat protein